MQKYKEFVKIFKKKIELCSPNENTFFFILGDEVYYVTKKEFLIMKECLDEVKVND